MVSNLFKQIYTLICMAHDIFSVFENNYLIFQGYNFSSWVTNILNEILEHNTNKEKLY